MKNLQINCAFMAKKKIIIAMMLILPMAVSAQKFGHVNTQEILPLMTEYKTMLAKIDSAGSQLEKELMTYQEEIQRKYQDYQAQEATMSEALKKARQEEIQDMTNRFETFRQQAYQDIQKKQEEYFTPVSERLNQAIKAVGEREGYTYIFNSQAMVHIGNDALDATAAVKKELGIK